MMGRSARDEAGRRARRRVGSGRHEPVPRSSDVGLLVLRAGVGATLFAHGAQKLFGWFGGHGLEATGAGFERMGFRPGYPSALAAGLGEAGGGLLLATGLATGLGAAAAAATMAVAASTHVPNGFFNQNRGLEFPLSLGVAAFGLSLTGPGRFSLDRLLGWEPTSPRLRAVPLLAAASLIARRLRALRSERPAGVVDPHRPSAPDGSHGQPGSALAGDPGAPSRPGEA